MRPVTISLLGGLTLVTIALVLTMLGSPMSVARTTRVLNKPGGAIATTTQSASYCQDNEVIPKDVSAIRVWLDAAAGPRVRISVSSLGHVVVAGTRGSDWTGGTVTVPVRPLGRAITDATVCIAFPLHDETVIAAGEFASGPYAARSGGHALKGRLWIEYLRPGTRSWASLAPSIIRHMGFGRAGTGAWPAFLVIVLLATTIALGSSLAHKELR